MSFTCEICGASFESQKALDKHFKKCHQCSHCGKVFKTLRSKKNHVRDVHSKHLQKEEEPSFADLARQAEIDHAMGECNGDYYWLCDP